jgi:hypothetical protein
VFASAEVEAAGIFKPLGVSECELLRHRTQRKRDSMILATLCYVKHNGCTLMVHRIKMRYRIINFVRYHKASSK